MLKDIKFGQPFNAYVRRGEHSTRLDGKDGTGQLSFGCPEIATKVNEVSVESKISVYPQSMFRIEKVK